MRAIDAEIGVAEAAALLGRSERRVRQLCEDGYITRTARGRYSISDIVKGYQKAALSEKVAQSAAQLDDHIRDLRAKELEVRIELRTQTYLKQCQADAVAIADELCGGVRNDLYALPARVTSDLILRRKIEDEIDGVFQAASERAAAVADREAAGGGDVAPATADDTGSMGEAKSGLSAVRGEAGPT